MRIVVQRVIESSVTVDKSIISRIGHGMNLLVCIENHDNEALLKKAAKKIKNLRIFSEAGSDKLNLNIMQTGGEVLAISQFTLSWRGTKGNRPSFDNSKEPNEARFLFDEFIKLLKNPQDESENTLNVFVGEFGADMKVAIKNDGPVTFVLDF